MKPSALPIFLCMILCLLTHLCQAQTWEAVNPPLNLFNGTIHATTVDASGNIYAGGTFKNSDRYNFVAKWNGSDWIEVGSGSNRLKAIGTILALAHHGDTLYAAGTFTNGASTYYVAKWNGSTWSELDKSATLKADGFIYSLAVDKAGHVYAAGNFTDSTDSYYVAKWNGTTWSQLGTGSNALKANRTIYAVSVDAAGQVYAGGYFTNAAGKQYVARWNGTTWNELGTDANALVANDHIRTLAIDEKGNLYAGGSFRNSNGDSYVAKWNGSNWSEMGTGSGALQANSNINTVVAINENEVYAAGRFTDIGGSYYVARWDGTAWLPVSDTLDPWYNEKPIETVAVDAAGKLYAGGQFLNKSGHSYIAVNDASRWRELGAHGDQFFSSQPIYQLVGDSVGKLYVSGNFKDNGGWYYLQHYNGKSWSELHIPYYSSMNLIIVGPQSLALDKKGRLYATGRKAAGDKSYDCLLTWDGTTWKILEDSPNSMGSYNDNGSYGITAIETDTHGNIYVSGKFNDPVHGISSIAKWNGTTWTRLRGSLADYIKEFCVAGDGNIYAYGAFTNEGRVVIATYNPATQNGWTEVRNGSSRLGVPGFNVFYSLATDSKNHLYVNGNFTNTAGKRYVARWDGNAWSELGPTSSLGLKLAIDQNDNIYTNKDANTYTDPVLKWDGTSWRGAGATTGISPLNFLGDIVATDAVGNVYSNAHSSEPGVGSYIVKMGATSSAPPHLLSFTPTSGSVGTTITISGKNLSGTTSVSFGGTPAASYRVKNDSTITAIVGNGSTGSVAIKTSAGEASLQTFTYTCDSVKGPIPIITLANDSTLKSSTANHYQWYFNNKKLPDAISNTIVIKNAGFYHVETSWDKTCWVPSLDYPVIITRSTSTDSLQLLLYPNPSPGNFTTYVKLSQVTNVIAYVQVYDINGNLVHQTNKLIFYGNEVRIPVTINTKGTYVVKVTVNDKTVQQTLIIQ